MKSNEWKEEINKEVDEKQCMEKREIRAKVSVNNGQLRLPMPTQVEDLFLAVLFIVLQFPCYILEMSEKLRTNTPGTI